jgi:BirA family biotin operon repressor/biotin-[acetyl-CoA-carboxylase] ligase
MLRRTTLVVEPFEALPSDLAVALAEARAACGEQSVDLYYRSEVGSTNDVVAGLAAAGAPEGTTVIADGQTAGRGRHGRTWHSPARAGLYMSVLFRPASDTGDVHPACDDETALITLMAGVVTSEAIEATTGLRAGLKWPNDLVVEKEDGSRRRRLKLAGILAEGVAIGSVLQHIVVGIGINMHPSALSADIQDRATSIEDETGRVPDRHALVAHLLTDLLRGRRDLAEGRGASVVQRWRERGGASMGQEVEWNDAAGRVRGLTCGIDNSGALLVDAGGRLCRIVAGEVTWL